MRLTQRLHRSFQIKSLEVDVLQLQENFQLDFKQLCLLCESSKDFAVMVRRLRAHYEPRVDFVFNKLDNLGDGLRGDAAIRVARLSGDLSAAWDNIPYPDSDVIDPEFFGRIKNIRFECAAQIANFKADLEKLKNGKLSRQGWMDLSSDHDKSFAELSDQLQRLRNEMQAASPEKPHPYFSQVEVCLKHVSGAQAFLQDEVLRALNCKFSANCSLDPAGKF